MESFYSIQGEGYHSGKPAYFVRLAGCDVKCSWCDVKDSWSNSASIPTEENIKAAAILWAEAQEKLKYKQQRKVGIGTTSGYPSIEYQLDQLYHDMKNNTLNTSGEWYVGITSVKTSFPKPS